MKGPPEVARGWFDKAESDLTAARILLAGPGPYDAVCFHCQQAVEKYIKGFLCWRGSTFPFTHDLGRLAPLCEAADPTLKLSTPEVIALTDYAVRLRYDNGFWPSHKDGTDAVAVAERVRSAIMARVPPGTHPGPPGHP